MTSVIKFAKKRWPKSTNNPQARTSRILKRKSSPSLQTFSTTLGGGNHDHVGVIMDPMDYNALTTGIGFINPVNPGIYPAGLAANAAAGTRAREEAIKKRAHQPIQNLQRHPIGNKRPHPRGSWQQKSKRNQTQHVGIFKPNTKTNDRTFTHLRKCTADTKELLAKRNGEWNVSKNPQVYFNRVEKAIKGLATNGITSDPNKRRDIALFHLKATGEFDPAIRIWEAKPAADKTWVNIKTFISVGYAKENKQNKLSVKHFKINAMQEQAEATEELIANLTEAHTQQM